MTSASLPTKSSVIALFGAPNAGKSTLLNALVGERLAPVHRKAQMTRKNLVGLCSREGCQLVFIDTPGFHDEDRPFNRELRQELNRALSDCDHVLVLIDAGQALDPLLRQKIEAVIREKAVLFVLNKADLPPAKRRLDEKAMRAAFPGGDIISISALTGKGVEALRKRLEDEAHPGPLLFPEDDLTTANLRELAAQTVLEKVMEHLHEELPYQIAVAVESYVESTARDTISAVIAVNRDSQKGMVIGRGGITLKKIGSDARRALEQFLGRKVRLELFVKVDRDWVKDPVKIRGYHGFTAD
jgi:GTP-binding protein Era